MENLDDLPRKEIKQLCEALEIRRLVVFGSFAKGTQTPGSDVDFYAEYLDERYSYKVRPKLKKYLKKIVHRDVDLIGKFRTESSRIFKHAVEVEGYEVYRAL